MLKNCWVLLLWSIPLVSCLNVTFEPTVFEKFRTGETGNILVKVSEFETETISITARCEDEFICSMLNHPAVIESNSEKEVEFNVTVKAEFFGFTNVTVVINDELLRSNTEHITSTSFTAFIGVFIVVVTFMMGTQLKVEQIHMIVKKPIGPMIGFFCQFGLMPLIGFVIANYCLASFDHSVQLALFAVATCPGGGKSSFWTIIFGGNFDLSISMTFFQTLAALCKHLLLVKSFRSYDATLAEDTRNTFHGRHYPHYNRHVLFTYLRPQYVDVIQKWITRVSWASMIILTIFAVYTNFYMIWLVNWTIFACACALPWVGYILAFLLATLLRQDFKNSITIAIETGIQNVGIAMVLIYLCLPEPESDISVMIIFVMAIMTDKPLIAFWLGSRIYRRIFKKDTITQDHYDMDSGSDTTKEKVDSNENSVVAV